MNRRSIVSATFLFTLAALTACGDPGAPSLADASDAALPPVTPAPESSLPAPDPEPETESEPPSMPRTYPASPPTEVHAERPARVVIPANYDASTPTSLVLLLHGYGATGFLQQLFLRMGRAAEKHQALLVTPNGSRDSAGFNHWNSTDGCCDQFSTGVDDVAYLVEVLDLMEESFNIDRGRVYVFGHSNGGFMAYRLACEAANRITAIASLGAATWENAEDCRDPNPPASVLEIHGTWDPSILYQGAGYPSSPDTVARWADRAGCDLDAPVTGEAFDLVTANPGNETTATRYEAGCRAGVTAELWTMERGGHAPIIRPDGMERIFDWFMSHRRE